MKTIGIVPNMVAFGQNFGEVKVVKSNQTYQDGTPVVNVYCYTDGFEEQFGRLTVCVPDTKLEDGEFLVKTWSENVWANRLLEESLFEDTGKRVPTGFCEAQIWKLR